MTAIEQLALLGINTKISEGKDARPKDRGAVMAGLEGAIRNPKASPESRERAAQRLLEMKLQDQTTTA